MTVRVGVVGLGYWGPNVVRNMSRVAELAWCCDLSAENRDRYAPQYPQARFTGDFDDLLNDPSLDAIAVASSVPTHHPLGLPAARSRSPPASATRASSWLRPRRPTGG